jgi:hypothetical protein
MEGSPDAAGAVFLRAGMVSGGRKANLAHVGEAGRLDSSVSRVAPDGAGF